MNSCSHGFSFGLGFTATTASAQFPQRGEILGGFLISDEVYFATMPHPFTSQKDQMACIHNSFVLVFLEQ